MSHVVNFEAKGSRQRERGWIADADANRMSWNILFPRNDLHLRQSIGKEEMCCNWEEEREAHGMTSRSLPDLSVDSSSCECTSGVREGREVANVSLRFLHPIIR